MTPGEQPADFIPELSIGEVLCFASTPGGLHGAGEAGWAFKGTSVRDYGSNAAFKQFLAGEGKRGLRAIWGQSKGPQEGLFGLGFAIESSFDWEFDPPTVDAHHLRKYQDALTQQLRDLALFAEGHPGLTFVVGSAGLNPPLGQGMLDLSRVAGLWKRTTQMYPRARFRFTGPLGELFGKVLEPVSRVSFVPLVAGSKLQPNDIYIGGIPGQESPLADPNVQWEGEVPGFWRGRIEGDREGAVRRYRNYLLALLGTSGPARDLLGAIAARAETNYLRLVTVGEDSVHGPVLVRMLAMRGQLFVGANDAAI